ncbi:7 transmembrane sweet-taste receptor of 3 GCPR-domain-containing protein [Fimicolochytrium jonesii]|uniref:7 transmembrane sweet-taste receptor of 3 GCPR-domain-containing protein n=1 Tax=Fimicolochytrium jonesii TaxID=1396493 RepID=UPI0022FDF864|nr:7 transmembrane sweet-taste receptor of 3 GCPR-domain-containing protein [Fimicolochytrium jonesii]KAI8817217.1 7 transmembrane sweet-taste receptor of 3 GCPR-domain-containing protein [Fimicolochytrium jonesii]
MISLLVTALAAAAVMAARSPMDLGGPRHPRKFPDKSAMSFMMLSPYSTNLVYYNAIWGGFNSSANILQVDHTVKVATDSDASTYIKLIDANVGSSASTSPTGFTMTIQDATAYVDVLNDAMYNNGPVFVSAGGGSTVSPSLGVPTHVGMDDFQSGYEAALKMASLGSQYGMCILHSSGSASAQARCAGWFAGYAGYYGPNVMFSSSFNGSDPTANPYAIVLSSSSATASATLSKILTTTRTDVDAIIISSGQLMNIVLTSIQTVRSTLPSRVIRFGTYDFVAGVVPYIASNQITFAIHQQEVFLGFLSVAYMYTLAAVNETAIAGAAQTGPIFVTNSNLGFYNDTLNNLNKILAAPKPYRISVILHGNDRDAEMPIVLRGIQDAATAWGYAIQEEYHTFSATSSFSASVFDGYLVSVFAGCGSNPAVNKPCPQGLIISRPTEGFLAAAKVYADQYSIAVVVVGLQKEADHTALHDTDQRFFEVGANDWELGYTAAKYLYATGSRNPLCFYHDGFVSSYMDRCQGMIDYYAEQNAPLNLQTAVFVDAEYAANADITFTTSITPGANTDGILLASSATTTSYRSWSKRKASPSANANIKAGAVVAVGKSADVVAALSSGDIAKAFVTQPYATGFYATYHLAIQMNTGITGLKSWYLKTGPLERTYGCPRGYVLMPDKPLYGNQPNSSFLAFGALCSACPQHTYTRMDDDPHGCIPCNTGYYNNHTASWGCGSGDDGYGKLHYPDQCPTIAEMIVTRFTATSKGLMGIGIAGAIVSASMGVLLIVFRNAPRIKSGGAYFSALITFGSAVGCLSIVTFAAEPSTPMCTTTVWLLGMSVSTVLSNLIIKNYRIYKIFFNRRAARVSEGNFKVFMQAAGLTSVTMLILIVWTIVSAPTAMLVSAGSNNYYVCSSSSPGQGIFSGLLFGWNGILIVSGLAVAYLTRNISSVFSESKNIALGIYNILVMSLIAVGAGYLAGDAVNFNFKLVLVSICILVGSLAAPGLLFGKRIYETIMAKADNMPDEESSSGDGGGMKSMIGAAGSRKKSVAGAVLEFEKATVLELPDCSVLQSGLVAAWAKKTAYFVTIGTRSMAWLVDTNMGNASGAADVRGNDLERLGDINR